VTTIGWTSDIARSSSSSLTFIKPKSQRDHLFGVPLAAYVAAWVVADLGALLILLALSPP
jgi:hypothetical protein